MQPFVVNPDADYDAEAMQPLCIRVHLKSAVYALDIPMLDGVLAAAVVRQRYQASLIPDVPEGHSPVALLPLQRLWQDGAGFPLYACTAFAPEGEVHRDTYYHHKRHQSGVFTKRTRSGKPFAPKTTEGRYRDRQRPLATVATEWLSCLCVGDANAIAPLLGNVSAIGKERARGLGHILEWQIEPAENFTLTPSHTLARNIPMEAIADLALEPLYHRNATLGAWTAPYWQNGLYSLVYQAGTEL